jgi:microsomal dipeptidase-like Zn-dependent dipeptidase
MRSAQASAQAITVGFAAAAAQTGTWILQEDGEQSEGFAAAGVRVLSLVFRFPAQDRACVHLFLQYCPTLFSDLP